MILLQVDVISSDEPEIVCESSYEIEDILIFAWFTILGIKYYCWLCSPIWWLPLNGKVDYLVHTI
jgi:hypothetical protein